MNSNAKYDHGEGHALAGWRVGDFEVGTLYVHTNDNPRERTIFEVISQGRNGTGYIRRADMMNGSEPDQDSGRIHPDAIRIPLPPPPTIRYKAGDHVRSTISGEHVHITGIYFSNAVGWAYKQTGQRAGMRAGFVDDNFRLVVPTEPTETCAADFNERWPLLTTDHKPLGEQELGPPATATPHPECYVFHKGDLERFFTDRPGADPLRGTYVKYHDEPSKVHQLVRNASIHPSERHEWTLGQ